MDKDFWRRQTQMEQIASMNDVELEAAIRVLTYQTTAKLFIGDISERQEVLSLLYNERNKRNAQKEKA